MEAILSMKWFYTETKTCQNTPRNVSRNLCGFQHGLPQRQITSVFNLGLVFLLILVISGCGQSLKTLAPIQPLHNFTEVGTTTTKDATEKAVVTSIPEEELAKPVFEKHGLQTVGVKIGDADIANTIALTYVLAFEENAHALDNWNNFLNDWAEIEPVIELPKADQDSKIVDVVLTSNHPQAFEINAKQSILTKTLDDITVSICYWRRADLDRKYNRGNTFSPFYENAAAGNQSENMDVFYVKITNNRSESIIIDVKKCLIIDQGESIYEGLYFEDIKDRFTSDRRVSGLYVKKALEKAREILLEKRMPLVEKQVGIQRVGVKPNDSTEGFIPFVQVKPNAVELSVIIEIEKVPQGKAQRYQKVDFKFPFTHNRGIRVAQPAPQRY